MTNDEFLQRFEVLTDAPNGIAKLRELILQLAVRGKLVAQDPDDEPASVLLEKIRAEKERLVAERKIKKIKPMPTVDLDEVSFVVPESWLVVRVGSFVELISGQHLKPEEYTDVPEGMPYITGPADFGAKYPTPHRYTTIRKAVALCGDILLTVKGAGIGKLNVLSSECAAISRQLMAVRPLSVDLQFVLIQLQEASAHFQNQRVGIAIPGIGRDDVLHFMVGLPPLAEQHRIVAKVDQLMALCDELETEQKHRTETHGHLIRAAHQPLTQPRDPAEFRTAWQRIRDNFDGLHTTVDSVKTLRQTILQLAVQGKLVPQNPNDEPASVLLEKIREEKERLVAEGKIRKTKPLPTIDPEEMRFGVPRGWIWAHLTDALALVTDGDHQPPPRSESGKPFLVIGNLNRGRLTFDGCRWVPETYYSGLDWGRKPRIGDILYTVTGSYGVPIPVDCDTEFCVQRHVAILKAAQSTPSAYLMILLGSHYAFDYATAVATGIAQKTVPLKGLRTMPMPIAPVGEQSRIVAKVDLLMALCDELEAKIEANQTTAQRFAEAVVADLAA